jgi:glycerophosphoryl diester phosphodiesterase
VTPWPYPFWFAHRGAGRLAPENTLAAFRVGAAHGYRAFECDVKLSRDGVPFLLHDDTLERTTSGHGSARDLEWAALARLDAGRWRGRQWAGEPPASLDAIAAFCCASGHALDLEIKPSTGREAETGDAVAHAAAWLWRDAALPPLLSSFQPASLAAARDAVPALPRALLLARLRDTWLDEALALGCVAVVFDHALVDAAVLERLRAHGLRALAYTVNDEADVARMARLGLDGLVTDAVDRFSPARAGLA